MTGCPIGLVLNNYIVSSRFLSRVSVKPGSHMPPTYLARSCRHGLEQRCGICEHLSPTHNLPGIDRRLACEVELSSTSQANRRLSAIVGDENILCEHHRDMRTRRYPTTRHNWGRGLYHDHPPIIGQNVSRDLLQDCYIPMASMLSCVRELLFWRRNRE